MRAMRSQYAPFSGTSTCPPERGISVPSAASTEKVPLPWSGTHSWVPAPCTTSSSRSRIRPVMLLKSTSHEPQSRSIACRVRSDVVRGPGVRRKGSVLIGCPKVRCPLSGAFEQGRRLGRQHTRLVEADYLDGGGAARSGDTARSARQIGGGVDLDPGPFQARKDPAADLRRMLADAAAEGDHVDPGQLAHVRSEIMPRTATEYLDREFRTRIALPFELEELVHVGAAAGETLESAFGVELEAHLRGGQAAVLHDVQQRARIQVPGACSHDQTLERREAHAGCDRLIVKRRGHGAAAPELQTDAAPRRLTRRQTRARLAAQIPVRRAVEAVAPHAEVTVPALRDRVAPGDFRQLGMIGGVEYADERHAGREVCAYARDHRE